jgi:hypothetical protein
MRLEKHDVGVAIVGAVMFFSVIGDAAPTEWLTIGVCPGLGRDKEDDPAGKMGGSITRKSGEGGPLDFDASGADFLS